MKCARQGKSHHIACGSAKIKGRRYPLHSAKLKTIIRESNIIYKAQYYAILGVRKQN